MESVVLDAVNGRMFIPNDRKEVSQAKNKETYKASPQFTPTCATPRMIICTSERYDMKYHSASVFWRNLGEIPRNS